MPEPLSELPRPREAGPPQLATPAGTPSPGDQPTDLIAPPSAGPPPVLPIAIPGYEIERELGRGGMGVVYKARHVALDRTVALKMVRGDAYADPELLARFREEASAAARLQHPNIVQIYEVGESDAAGEPRPYLALEFVEGVSLAEAMRGTPQPARAAAALVETLSRAIQHALQKGVVHRDLKPANVQLSLPREPAACALASGSRLNEVVPKITDFGLAKRLDANQSQTETGAVLGTPSYMAPEQAWGKSRLRPVGPWTDVYALGAILYTLLTGRPPFLADGALETLQLITSDEEPVPPRRLRPQVPRGLETITLKCLQKNPHKRYASAEALADDLARFLRGEPIRARPVGPVERGVRWARRHPARAALLVVMLLSLGAVTAFWRLAVSRGELAERRYREAYATINDFYTRVSEDVLLREPGMQPLRRQLLGKALAAYQRFLAERGEDAALRAEVARAHWRVGRIQTDLGADEAARDAFRRAEELQEALHRASPGDAMAALDLALTCNALGNLRCRERSPGEGLPLLLKARDLLQPLADTSAADERFLTSYAGILNDVGLAHTQLAQVKQAEEAFEKARALRDQLARRSPNSPVAQADLAASHHNLGLLWAQTARAAQARAAFFKARAVQSRLVSDHPNVSRYRSDLADHLDSLAAAQTLTGEHADAARTLQQAHVLRLRLVADNPAVAPFRRGLAEMLSNRGRLQVKTGRYAEAADSFREATAGLERLLKQFATFTLLRDAARAFAYLGTVQVQLKQRAEAERSFARAGELLTRLERDYRTLPEDGRTLGEVHYFVGTALKIFNRPEQARAAFAKALAYWPPVLESAPGDEGLRKELNTAYFTQGQLLRDAGQHAEAARLARQRRKLWPRDADQVGDAACELARCALVVGKGKTALSAAEQAQRDAYEREAVALLREALALRPQDPQGMLADHDFDALRRRSDFQEVRRAATAKKSGR